MSGAWDRVGVVMTVLGTAITAFALSFGREHGDVVYRALSAVRCSESRAIADGVHRAIVALLDILPYLAGVAIVGALACLVLLVVRWVAGAGARWRRHHTSGCDDEVQTRFASLGE